MPVATQQTGAPTHCVLALAVAVEYLRGALFELLTADEPSFVEVLLRLSIWETRAG